MITKHPEAVVAQVDQIYDKACQFSPLWLTDYMYDMTSLAQSVSCF